MAVVILCGLMTSTLLNMVVVPTMYLRYAEPEPVRQSEPAASVAEEDETRRAPFGPPPYPVRSEG